MGPYKNVEMRIQKIKEKKKLMEEIAKSSGIDYSDVFWLFVAIPSFGGACGVAVCLCPFMKGYFRYKREMARESEESEADSNGEEVEMSLITAAA